MTTNATADLTRRPITAAELAWAGDCLDGMEQYFTDVVVGQASLRRSLFVALLGRGHILLESVPGLAKTLAASTLAHSVAGTFARIQCTPDLLPSDIIGTQVFDPATLRFTTELGPVHANFVLLDEINRSSAKTQSAMLEAMQERQTSIGGRTHLLPDPFVVMATQNPIEEEGTYVLPQAQMDRFLIKEIVRYPTAEEEFTVLGRTDDISTGTHGSPSATAADVIALQDLTRRVHVDDSIRRYIVELVNVTRHPADHLPASLARWIDHGASPRGAIAFLNSSRAQALLSGRDHVVPDDVTSLRHAVLRHRIVPTFEALAERVDIDNLIDEVAARVPTP